MHRYSGRKPRSFVWLLAVLLGVIIPLHAMAIPVVGAASTDKVKLKVVPGVVNTRTGYSVQLKAVATLANRSTKM